jgi:hypothetical protein
VAAWERDRRRFEPLGNGMRAAVGQLALRGLGQPPSQALGEPPGELRKGLGGFGVVEAAQQRTGLPVGAGCVLRVVGDIVGWLTGQGGEDNAGQRRGPRRPGAPPACPAPAPGSWSSQAPRGVGQNVDTPLTTSAVTTLSNLRLGR